MAGLQKVKPGDPVIATPYDKPVSTAELASLNPAS